MYSSWIYTHFINTIWFVATLLSIPFGFLAFLLYLEIKQNAQNNDGSQSE